MGAGGVPFPGVGKMPLTALRPSLGVEWSVHQAFSQPASAPGDPSSPLGGGGLQP